MIIQLEYKKNDFFEENKNNLNMQIIHDLNYSLTQYHNIKVQIENVVFDNRQELLTQVNTIIVYIEKMIELIEKGIEFNALS